MLMNMRMTVVMVMIPSCCRLEDDETLLETMQLEDIAPDLETSCVVEIHLVSFSLT